MRHVSPKGFEQSLGPEKRWISTGGMNPKWSPDGMWLAWTQQSIKSLERGKAIYRFQIWCARADGSALQLAFEDTDDIRWSGDGKQIINVRTNDTYDVVEASEWTDSDRDKWPEPTDEWFQDPPDESK